MSGSALALLEILDGYCFRKTLCIDVDDEVNVEEGRSKRSCEVDDEMMMGG